MSFFVTIAAAFIVFFNLLIIPIQPLYKVITKPKPITVRGIYWTAYTAGTKSLRQPLINLIEDTEINAVVIDLKDSTGRIFFDTNISLANETGAEQLRIPDLKDLITKLKEKNIYLIARLAVFQDPFLAEKKPELALKRKGGGLWRDWKGLAWVDTSSQEVWKYNLDVAKAAIDLGFDEINFDYIRFPSDGNLKQIEYPFHTDEIPKNEVLRQFFQYVDKELKYYPVYTSADLFGMTLWREDGLGIGQRFEDAAPYFDYICPMVYPSHYPDGFQSYSNPALYPYEIVKASLDKGKEAIKNQRAKFRPWLQDFDLGASYDASMVRKQIQATYDAGWQGWMLWNASNRYTVAALY